MFKTLSHSSAISQTRNLPGRALGLGFLEDEILGEHLREEEEPQSAICSYSLSQVLLSWLRSRSLHP